MLVNILGNPVDIFLDGDGQPLQDGLIFIGQPNTDPTNSANQITVFQDSGLTIPFQQPIETINGQPAINGSQAVVYLGVGTTSYSLAVMDSDGVIVMSLPSVQPFTLGGSASGSMVVKEFVSGTDFTGGTTTSLPLSTNFASGTNLWVDFDGVPQHYPDDFTLSGTTLNFTSPIPVGIHKVFTKGGTTASIGTPADGTVTDSSVAAGTKLYNRLNDFIDVRDPAYGAICNGTTDDTAAVQRAINAIGTSGATLIIPGPTLVSGALTFAPNTQLWFLNGGYFVGVAGTEVITLQSAPLAASKPIFKNCAPISTRGMTVYPEWFGAVRDGATSDTSAFNLAYGFLKNTGGVIQMAAGTYALDTAINNCQSHVALRGAGQNITVLSVTSTTVDGIDCIGVAGTPISNAVFELFNVSCSGASTTGTGINLQYTALAKVTDIQVINFIAGVFMQRATNTFFTRVGASYAGSTANFTGWVISGSGTGAGGNASSVWRDCYVDGSQATGGGSIGYKAYGAYVSDYYFDNCSTASTNYGFELDYSTAAAGGYADVALINPVVDNFTLQGILVNALPTGQKLTITAGWINPASTGAETDDIYITGSGGQVSIDGGIQLQGDNNHANAIGLRVINSNNVKVGNALFGNCNYGIKESGSGFNQYSGSFWNSVADAATAHVSLIGSSRSMVTSATFQGSAGVGVSADNTSTAVGVVGCTFNAGTITTRVSNLSTGPVGSSDGSTGLNSGI